MTRVLSSAQSKDAFAPSFRCSHRVSNPWNLGSSPVTTLASSRAWISSTRR